MIGSITSRCSGDEPDTRERQKSSLAVWLKLMDPLIIGQNWLADQASSQTKNVTSAEPMTKMVILLEQG